MPVGSATVEDYYNILSFKVVEKVKILGFEIDSKLEKLADHFDKSINNVQRICNFWGRFNLSLPSRIGIAKTLLLSQIGYYGSILNPTEDQFITLENMIASFVSGKLGVAKSRIFEPVVVGGTRNDRLKEYVTALQSAWVKKAFTPLCDN